MQTYHIIEIGIILFLCSNIQGAVGFAFNIFAIPLLIWSGEGLPESIVLTSIPIFVQNMTSSIKLREYIPWKEVWIGTLFRYMGIPIGIYILTLLNNFDKNTIKQIVGIVILLIVFSQTCLKLKPQEKINFFWTFIAFFSSGVFLGMISMGGPAAILWVMVHKWNALKIRAFLSALFFMASPFVLILLYYNFGNKMLTYFFIGLCFTPIVIIGTLIGVRIGNLLDSAKLKKIIMFLLIATSLFSIFSPYI